MLELHLLHENSLADSTFKCASDAPSHLLCSAERYAIAKNKKNYCAGFMQAIDDLLGLCDVRPIRNYLAFEELRGAEVVIAADWILGWLDGNDYAKRQGSLPPK